MTTIDLIERAMRQDYVTRYIEFDIEDRYSVTLAGHGRGFVHGAFSTADAITGYVVRLDSGADLPVTPAQLRAAQVTQMPPPPMPATEQYVDAVAPLRDAARRQPGRWLRAMVARVADAWGRRVAA